MLVPNFQFGGRCETAIALYEKALNATVDTVLYNRDMSGNPDDVGVGHAEMHIHGQRVMLNDRSGNPEQRTESAVQMVLIFGTKEELLHSYALMNQDITVIDPLQETFYSPLVTCFVDMFGVEWCFMVDENPRN